MTARKSLGTTAQYLMHCFHKHMLSLPSLQHTQHTYLGHRYLAYSHRDKVSRQHNRVINAPDIYILAYPCSSRHCVLPLAK